MAVPLCLPNNCKWFESSRKVSFDKDDTRDELQVCPQGCELLETIKDELVVVICITGPARTGKSFFLSNLQRGVTFELGHSTKSHTTGIWIALGPEPIVVNERQARLVLLDAEGLDAVSTYDEGSGDEWDRKVFSLCTLLSSYLIYNSKGTPTNSDLDKLGFIAKFSQSVFQSTQDSDKGGQMFKDFAPHFLWLIRDAHLQPVYGDEMCDWGTFVRKEVLEVADDNEKISSLDFQEKIRLRKRGNVRKAILETFRSFNAFGLPCPSTDPDILQNLSFLENSDSLNKSFVESMSKIKDIILSTSVLKQIKGCYLSGEALVTLLHSFVDAINKEVDSICVEDMWTAVVNSHLEKSKQESLNSYTSSINPNNFPISAEELADAHNRVSDIAIALFDKAVERFDSTASAEVRASLRDEIEKEITSLKDINDKISRKFCEKKFKEIEERFWSSIEAKAEKNNCADLTEAKANIFQEYLTAAKGPMADIIREEKECRIDDKIPKLRVIIHNATETNLDQILEGDVKNLKKDLPMETAKLEKMLNGIVEKFDEVLSAKCDDCNVCEDFKKAVISRMLKHFDNVKQVNISTSNIYCQKLADSLKVQYLESNVSSVLTSKYSELETVQTKILAEYDKKAKGPDKESVRKKCEDDIMRQLMLAQKSIADISRKNLSGEYRKEMGKFLKDGPYEGEELLNKSDDVIQSLLETFHARCNGIQDFQKYKDIILDEIENEKIHILKENVELSRARCKTISQTAVQDFKSRCLGILAQLNDIDKNFDCNVAAEMVQIKQQQLSKFDVGRIGPAGQEAKKLCEDELNKHKLEAEIDISHAALRNSCNMYKALLDEIGSNGPYDTNKLEQLQSEAASKVFKYFNNICEGFEKSNYEKEITMLQSLIDNQNKTCHDPNTKQSRIFCESVKSNVMKEFQKYFQKHLKPLLNVEFKGDEKEILEFDTLKGKFLEKYENDAKGPEKDNVRANLENEIESTFIAAKQEVVTVAFSVATKTYRLSLKNAIDEGPLDADDLKILKQTASLDTFKLFRNRCTGFDQKLLSTQETLLTSFIEDQDNYIDERNKAMSREFCERLKTELIRKHQQCCSSIAADACTQDLNCVVDVTKKIKEEVEKIFNTFDKSAKGPQKAEARQLLMSRIHEEITATQNGIADAALRMATDAYQNEMIRILGTDCSNMDEIKKMENDAASEVIKLFQNRCKGFDQNMLTMKEEKIIEFINKHNATSYDHRFQKSLQMCENLRKKVVSQYKDETQMFLDKVYVADLANVKDVMISLGDLKKTSLEKYEAGSEGPAKDEVHIKCSEEIDAILQSLKKDVARVVLGKAENRYKDHMDTIMRKGPHDVQYVTNIERDISSEVLSRFEEICLLLKDPSSKNLEVTLLTFMKNYSTNANHRNSDKSRDSCEKLKFTLIQHCQNQVDKLCDQITREKLDTFSKFVSELFNVKRVIVERFESEAKGPSKDEIKQKLNDELRSLFKIASEEIASMAMTKGQEEYRRKIKVVISNGPYDVENLNKHSKEVTDSVLQLFMNALVGISHTVTNKYKHSLQTFLEDNHTLTSQLNSGKSHSLCKQEKAKQLRECKRSFKAVIQEVHEKSLDEIGIGKTNIAFTLKTTQDKHMDAFDEIAKGPEKEELRENLADEIENEKGMAMSTIADAVLSKCLIKYTNVLDQFIETSPRDENELKVKERKEKEYHWKLLRKICANFDENLILIREQTFIAAIKEYKGSISCQNSDTSRNFCNVQKNIILAESEEEFNKFVSKVKKTDLEDIVNIQSTLINVKDKFLAKYDRNSKGSVKGEIKDILTNALDAHVQKAKVAAVSFIFQKAQNKFKDNLYKNIDGKVKSEGEIRRRVEDASQDVYLYLEAACLDMDPAFISSRQETLQKFIDSQMERAVTGFIHSSQSLCTEMKQKIVVKCADLFKKEVEFMSEDSFQRGMEHLSKLDKIKCVLLQEYDSSTKGPEKAKIQSELAAKIDELLLISKKEFAEILLEKGKEAYRYNITSIFQNFPLEENNLCTKQSSAEQVQMFYQNLCSAIGESITSYHREAFQSFANEMKQECSRKNHEVSATQCAMLCQQINKNCTLRFNSVVNSLSNQSLYEIEAILPGLEQIKVSCIKDFDLKAQGPAKFSAKQTCVSNVSASMNSAQKNVAAVLYEKCRQSYKSALQLIMADCPCEERDLLQKESNVRKKVTSRVESVLRGFEEHSYFTYNSNFKTFMEEQSQIYCKHNASTSFEFCVSLINQMLRSGNYRNVDIFRRSYRAKARGPKVNEALEFCQNEIDKKFSGLINRMKNFIK